MCDYRRPLVSAPLSFWVEEDRITSASLALAAWLLKIASTESTKSIYVD